MCFVSLSRIFIMCFYYVFTSFFYVCVYSIYVHFYSYLLGLKAQNQAPFLTLLQVHKKDPRWGPFCKLETGRLVRPNGCLSFFFPRQGPLHGSLAWLSPCNPIAAQKTPAHFHNYSVSSFLYHCIPCKPPSKASSNVTFIPLPVPQIDGLPLGVESTSELPMHKVPHQKKRMTDLKLS